MMVFWGFWQEVNGGWVREKGKGTGVFEKVETVCCVGLLRMNRLREGKNEYRWKQERKC